MIIVLTTDIKSMGSQIHNQLFHKMETQLHIASALNKLIIITYKPKIFQLQYYT